MDEVDSKLLTDQTGTAVDDPPFVVDELVVDDPPHSIEIPHKNVSVFLMLASILCTFIMYREFFCFR